MTGISRPTIEKCARDTLNIHPGKFILNYFSFRWMSEQIEPSVIVTQ